MPGPVTNLRSLDSANFKTSKRADGVNDVLKAKLGLQHRYEPARLTIAHSLALPEPAPPLAGDDADDSGKVIMGKTLFGDDELPVWVALIVEKSGLPHPSVEDIQEQVRRHWQRGILLLQAEWESCAAENSEGVYERFILFLAQRAGLPAHGLSTGGHGGDEFVALTDRRAVPVSLRLGDPGTDERTGTPATWLLNGKGSPHVALMGGTGSGKTRLARSLLGQIRAQTKVPCAIFDFKGDLAGNPDFVRDTPAAAKRVGFEFGRAKVDGKQKARAGNAANRNIPLPFLGKTMDYRVPKGWVLPMLSAFRANVTWDLAKSRFAWKVATEKLLASVIDDMVRVCVRVHVENKSRPEYVGKTESAYAQCYDKVQIQLARLGPL